MAYLRDFREYILLFPRVVLEARDNEVVSSNSKVKAKVGEGKSLRLFETV